MLSRMREVDPIRHSMSLVEGPSTTQERDGTRETHKLFTSMVNFFRGIKGSLPCPMPARNGSEINAGGR